MITLIDLSHPIKNHMPVYPGDEAPQIEGINSFAQNGFNNYRWTTSMHIGTHIDGPMHMTESKQFIGDIPPERCMGTGYFIDASGEKIIPRKNEYESHVQPDSIVVIYTGFGKKFGSIEYHSEQLL